MAAQLARARTEIDHVVGMADGLFVVLDDQDRIAQVAQGFESLDQALVVALVQADRGLIEHVEHAAQPRADLRGQANALAFAAGERRGIAVQRQIAEPDGVEKLQPLDDLRGAAARRSAPRGAENSMAARRVQRAANGSAVNSAMDMEPTLTASDSGRSRLPWQTGQVVADM